eukprot:gnl/TRDRNA2_/TRDRNA2_151268_c0_seq2.p1 gnl/TRDRNA2_/TRDRNA2_151268_c0~~gnl/TRDRNA2_/TRDRNA2_151268_c0_seq2.p1  ORF type:complete len:212 (+),score=33.36 gnl/TRDRNA2_/TRDRNA2_151268_c0_seq2:38-673(+)
MDAQLLNHVQTQASFCALPGSFRTLVWAACAAGVCFVCLLLFQYAEKVPYLPPTLHRSSEAVNLDHTTLGSGIPSALREQLRRQPPSASTPIPSSTGPLAFNTEEEVCGVCWEDVSPEKAVRLGCRHGWFCTQCLCQLAKAQLEAGSKVISCPQCRQSLAEAELQQLLPPELVQGLQRHMRREGLVRSGVGLRAFIIFLIIMFFVVLNSKS